jgi:hypothetical protein
MEEEVINRLVEELVSATVPDDLVDVIVEVDVVMAKEKFNLSFKKHKNSVASLNVQKCKLLTLGA